MYAQIGCLFDCEMIIAYAPGWGIALIGFISTGR